MKKTHLSKTMTTATHSQNHLRHNLTFEHFLRNNATSEGIGGSEFRLVIHGEKAGCLQVYIHPLGRDGSSEDYYVDWNNIHPKQAIDNIDKLLQQEERQAKKI